MATILRERKDDKVTPEDHFKFEQAFKDANVGQLSDNQKDSIYLYESNLIKMAKQTNKDGILATARDDIMLKGSASLRLETELFYQFGAASGGSNDKSATQRGPSNTFIELKAENASLRSQKVELQIDNQNKDKKINKLEARNQRLQNENNRNNKTLNTVTEERDGEQQQTEIAKEQYKGKIERRDLRDRWKGFALNTLTLGGSIIAMGLTLSANGFTCGYCIICCCIYGFACAVWLFTLCPYFYVCYQEKKCGLAVFNVRSVPWCDILTLNRSLKYIHWKDSGLSIFCNVLILFSKCFIELDDEVGIALWILGFIFVGLSFCCNILILFIICFTVRGKQAQAVKLQPKVRKSEALNEGMLNDILDNGNVNEIEAKTANDGKTENDKKESKSSLKGRDEPLPHSNDGSVSNKKENRTATPTTDSSEKERNSTKPQIYYNHSNSQNSNGHNSRSKHSNSNNVIVYDESEEDGRQD